MNGVVLVIRAIGDVILSHSHRGDRREDGERTDAVISVRSVPGARFSKTAECFDKFHVRGIF